MILFVRNDTVCEISIPFVCLAGDPRGPGREGLERLARGEAVRRV